MDYRRLGNSGTVVTSLCLGTMTFGDEADEATSFRLMDAYVEAGGNFIDTANVYSTGLSEEIVGRWLKQKPGITKELVIATKARFPMGNGPNRIGLSRKNLAEALDASLARLGVEQIDLYQLHAWDALTPLEESLRFLDDAIASGKIAYYGFSNFLGWHLTKAVWLAKANGFAAPVTLQPQYNLLARGIEHEIVPACADAGMGLLPWSPLAGGWLSGKYKRDQMPTGATRLGENPARGMEAYDKHNTKSVTWAVLDALEDIAGAHNASMAQVALAWLAAQPAVTSVIVGARTEAQLADNLGAAKLQLSADEIKRLSEVSDQPMPDYPYGIAGAAQRFRKIEGGR
ncbi:aldo/keto reductase [Martelella mediterranea]|uniref:aldo/keto reductase n=1 Tax=Martelella mediterranea TaxID=293089 RepID=UPI001E624E40|nr:aldo/keto reductase [Martelella mediterranea]MCD1633193.1 aldo/keto reductase [Martelella mediterranea]